MKNLILFLITALFSSNLLMASPLGDVHKKCRLDVTNTNTPLSLEEQLTEDLLSGVWTIENTGSVQQATVTSLQFTATGLVGMLTQSQENVIDYSHQIWRMQTNEVGLLLLVLTDLHEAKEQTYHVIRHCDGLSLTSMQTGEVTELIYHTHEQVKRLKATQKTLSGTWKSMIFPKNVANKQEKITSAACQYELKKDGTVQKILSGENMQAIVQGGFWQISPDGQYLILHLQEDAHFQTSIAKINYLAFDELVLGEIVATSSLEESLCKDIDTFYFNKQ